MRRGSILTSTTLASLFKASMRAIAFHTLRLWSIWEIPRQLLIPLHLIDSNVVKITLRCNYYEPSKRLSIFSHWWRTKAASSISRVWVGSLINIQTRYETSSLPLRPSWISQSRWNDSSPPSMRRGKKKQGWPSAGYAVSKAGVVGMTKAIGTAEKEKGSKVPINSCCPGYVKTDVTRWWIKNTRSRNLDTGYACIRRSQRS